MISNEHIEQEREASVVELAQWVTSSAIHAVCVEKCWARNGMDNIAKLLTDIVESGARDKQFFIWNINYMGSSKKRCLVN